LEEKEPNKEKVKERELAKKREPYMERLASVHMEMISQIARLRPKTPLWATQT
jgi:hypothetical protein